MLLLFVGWLVNGDNNNNNNNNNININNNNNEKKKKNNNNMIMIIIMMMNMMMMMIIALKGDNRFFFFFFFFVQSPYSAANCLQHVHSSGQGAIMCKSRTAHRVLITCNMSCATWYKGYYV